MAGIQLSELCRILGKNGFPATLDGPDRAVSAVNTLEDAGDGEISFLSNPKYVAALGRCRASAVIVQDGVALPDGASAIRCGDPYAAITVTIITLHGHRKHPHWGKSPQANIDASARIGQNANIAPGATIAAGAVIGDNCVIYPGAYVADHVKIGHDCTLFPNVVIYDHSQLGDRVTIHAGSVIGQDGLGYAPLGEKWIKIPQVGRTIIGDDVEIGANCAIDRATLGRTEIGAGTKFGNVIVVGHGTKIGPDCMFVGLVGIAGSTTIGRHVTLAGQVGVNGHITINDNASIGAQAGVVGDVEPNAKLLGSPAIPIDQAKRAVLAGLKLPEMIKRVREMEREIKSLREKVESNGRTQGARSSIE